MTEQQRKVVEKVFDDLERAHVAPIKAAATLGISVKAAKKGLSKARARRLGDVSSGGRTMMTPALSRSEGWHSLEYLDRARLTAFARPDDPVRALLCPPENEDL